MFEQQILAPTRRCSNGIRAHTLGTLLFLLFAAACSGPDALAPDRRHDDVGSSMAAVATGGDIRGIQQLVEEFESAFAAKNAVAYGNAYAENAEFLNPVGVLTSGRAAIVALHTLLFAGPFAPATFTAELVDVQFLTGTIALVDVNTTLAGAAGPPPPGASPDGTVRTRFRWLAQKRGGEWEILVSYHRGFWEI